jgi:hypothetical protein
VILFVGSVCEVVSVSDPVSEVKFVSHALCVIDSDDGIIIDLVSAFDSEDEIDSEEDFLSECEIEFVSESKI